MPDDFAKLFRHPEYGQVLVTLSRGDGDGDYGMEICIRMADRHDLVPEVTFKYPDDDDGLRRAEAKFDETDEAIALGIADRAVAQLDELVRAAEMEDPQ